MTNYSNERSGLPPITLESVAAAIREKAPPPTPVYTFASVSFRGEPIVDVSEIKWTCRYGVELPPTLGFGFRPNLSYSSSVTVQIKRRAWTRFMRELSRPRRLHASFETLMRRASYGGRKGRRAMRRLMAMSDATWREGLAR